MNREKLNAVLAVCATAFVLIFGWGALNKTKADRIVAEGTKRLADKFSPQVKNPEIGWECVRPTSGRTWPDNVITGWTACDQHQP